MASWRYWGTYGSGVKFQVDGWNVEVRPFTYSAPADWNGKTSWRYRMSRNVIVPGIWTDKNPRGRKFETRCYTSLEDAKRAAVEAVKKLDQHQKL